MTASGPKTSAALTSIAYPAQAPGSGKISKLNRRKNMGKYCEVSELLGKTVQTIIGGKAVDILVFSCSDGSEYKMYHQQDCCESVEIEDICGELSDLIGSPLLQAEVVSGYGSDPHAESSTWTFYKFATVKGAVTIRWHGSSNGYYSEEVDFVRTKDATV
jgi:hypothetical protein